MDTNVFLSGILFGGNPRSVVEAWLDNQFILCLSPELKAEILNKLRLKFLVPNSILGYVEEALEVKSEKYVPKTKVNVCKDPDDNFLLELAQEAHADYLVSGDKFVLELKKYKSAKIVTPREFLEILG